MSQLVKYGHDLVHRQLTDLTSCTWKRGQGDEVTEETGKEEKSQTQTFL
jgi:hypothetical protein